ncbi:MAG TPA: hypothetical protein VJS92_14275, partial [Candidatus Polarisedimenticolaceae bacterium]|nr:hypothetical protein [Candidatus Polarisedimenticolaceae bacterium]
ARAALLVVAAAIAARSVAGSSAYFDSAAPFDKFRGAAGWLRQHARPGDVVFHAHWDNFAALFYWYPEGTYINGMDPIFQYAESPTGYWKTHHLATGQGTATTCGAPRCTAAETEPTLDVLRREFHARYIFVQSLRNPRLDAYLRAVGDPVHLELDTGVETVFRLDPLATGRGPG